jgi:hypothetical protein
MKTSRGLLLIATQTYLSTPGINQQLTTCKKKWITSLHIPDMGHQQHTWHTGLGPYGPKPVINYHTNYIQCSQLLSVEV